MRRDPRELLFDIADACAAIGDFSRDRDAASYAADRLLRSACERQFEIIGEAMSRLRDLHPTVFARIEDGRQIIAFRNRLIHGYDSVDTEIVWDIIRNKLPPLGAATRHLMAEDPGPV